MVTMRDIAHACGYSRATVSAVINNRPGVSPRARASILKTIDKFKYRPNQLATSLKGSPSRLVGVVVRDMANPYFSMVFECVENVLSEAGYRILYFNTREDHQREVEAVQTLLSYKVDGIILTPIQLSVNLDHLRTLREAELPVITIEKAPGLDLDTVEFANYRAGALAAERLIAAGHRRLACIAGPATSQASEQRAKGFCDTLAKHGLGGSRNAVPAGSAAADGCQAAARLFQDREQAPTGIFCFSDLVATGVYQAAHKAGILIPDQLSVIGCDGIDLGEVLGPPLTTVSFSIDRVGQFVAGELIKNIESRTARSGLRRVFRPRVIERASVAPPEKTGPTRGGQR